MTVAVYPGSFDPVTNGHLDIATRTAALFEKVIIGVYAVPSKNLLFSTEERVDMLKRAVAHLPHVEVQPYVGLTVDFARKCKAKVVVRGLRMSADFEREFEMGMMNKKLAPDIELVCMMANLEYEFLSSSILKEVAQLEGCITDFVPEHVASALRDKFHLKP